MSRALYFLFKERLVYYLGVAIPYCIIYNDTAWAPKWHAGLTLCAFWLSVQLTRKMHWSVFLPLFITLANGIWYCESYLHHFSNLNTYDQTAIRELASRSCLSVLLIVVPLVLARPRELFFMAQAIGAFCFLNSLYVVYQYFLDDFVVMGGFNRSFYCSGLLGNAGMNACAIAFTYPFLFKLKKQWFYLFQKFPEAMFELFVLLIPVLAVGVTFKSMAYGTLGIVILSHLQAALRFRWRYYIGVGVVALFGFYCKMGMQLFNTSGRWAIWKGVMQFWKEAGGLWWGAGQGSSVVMIPLIQRAKSITIGVEQHKFFWLHNDLLQVLFELGVIGFISYLIMIGFCLKKSYNRPWLFASFCGLLVTSLGNYPARMFMHAFMGSFIVALILRKD